MHLRTYEETSASSCTNDGKVRLHDYTQRSTVPNRRYDRANVIVLKPMLNLAH